MSKPSSLPPEVPEPKPGLTLIREPARPILRILGEPFYVEHDGDYYILHKRWSLMGSGATLADAYKDLLQEASEVRPVYARLPVSKLDADCIRLQEFLLRFA